MAIQGNITESADVFQGSARTIKVTIWTNDDQSIRQDLTGWELTWVLAQTAGRPPVLQLATGTGVTTTNAAEGELEIAITPAQTATLPAGSYRHELWRSDGEPVLLLYGSFALRDAVQFTPVV